MINYQFNADRDEAGKAISIIGSGAIKQVPESTQPGVLIPTNTELYNPGSWLKNGDSPAEIILATSILVIAIGISWAVSQLSSKQR